MRNRRLQRPQPLLLRVRPVLGVGLRLAAGMALAGVMVLSAGLLVRMDLERLLRLEHTHISGDLRHLRPDAVEAILADHPRGLLVLDLEALRRELLTLPWVESVRLRKRWPDTLEVRITEPVPVARWGDDRLVDRHGEIFGPVDPTAWGFLPALEGESGRQIELMRRYLEVSAHLADVGLGVSGIRENARQAWSIRLDNGGEILMGRDGDLARLDQLIPLMPVLREGHPAPFARIDLRYARGAAVAWQTASGIGETEGTIR
ncbi:cell division protein FtsQ/DivIB [Thioalkalivibrio sp.]|uniref:cell division protein FtsQ/DivIB n=1 Tax=Thioalkalivibrio sp. TaxID=2093813 RepID=UPI003975F2A1